MPYVQDLQSSSYPMAGGYQNYAVWLALAALKFQSSSCPMAGRYSNSRVSRKLPIAV